ncbi:MAG: response regulator, partial [Thermodesulfovibrionales bacterium]
RNGVLSGECLAAKTNGKPCAGNPHARFERGTWERSGLTATAPDSTNDVTTACNAKRGLEIFEQQKNGIAAVVLDVLMPDMDGRRLFGKIRELDESMLVVLYSNYGYTDMLAEWGVPKDTPYVIKGNEHELVDIIRNAQQKKE